MDVQVTFNKQSPKCMTVDEAGQLLNSICPARSSFLMRHAMSIGQTYEWTNNTLGKRTTITVEPLIHANS